MTSTDICQTILIVVLILWAFRVEVRLIAIGTLFGIINDLFGLTSESGLTRIREIFKT